MKKTKSKTILKKLFAVSLASTLCTSTNMICTHAMKGSGRAIMLRPGGVYSKQQHTILRELAHYALDPATEMAATRGVLERIEYFICLIQSSGFSGTAATNPKISKSIKILEAHKEALNQALGSGDIKLCRLAFINAFINVSFMSMRGDHVMQKSDFDFFAESLQFPDEMGRGVESICADGYPDDYKSYLRYFVHASSVAIVKSSDKSEIKSDSESIKQWVTDSNVRAAKEVEEDEKKAEKARAKAERKAEEGEARAVKRAEERAKESAERREEERKNQEAISRVRAVWGALSDKEALKCYFDWKKANEVRPEDERVTLEAFIRDRKDEHERKVQAEVDAKKSEKEKKRREAEARKAAKDKAKQEKSEEEQRRRDANKKRKK